MKALEIKAGSPLAGRQSAAGKTGVGNPWWGSRLLPRTVLGRGQQAERRKHSGKRSNVLCFRHGVGMEPTRLGGGFRRHRGSCRGVASRR
jgi:hypothetical protein